MCVCVCACACPPYYSRVCVVVRVCVGVPLGDRVVRRLDEHLSVVWRESVEEMRPPCGPRFHKPFELSFSFWCLPKNGIFSFNLAAARERSLPPVSPLMFVIHATNIHVQNIPPRSVSCVSSCAQPRTAMNQSETSRVESELIKTPVKRAKGKTRPRVESSGDIVYQIS